MHRNGLWHRSAQVFLSDRDGRLLLQRRAPTKDLYAELWDYSVGEHVKPGEAYEAAARRGLAEELGVRGVAVEVLSDVVTCEHRGRDFWDRELQQAFRCVYDGPLMPDVVEVAELKFVALGDLRAWLARAPEEFTPWFAGHVRRYGYL